MVAFGLSRIKYGNGRKEVIMSYIGGLRKVIGNQRIISISCGAIIENEKEEILLQFRADTKNYGVPGGNMELGESLIETLKREIFEEIGLEIETSQANIFGVYSGDKCTTIYPNGDEVQYVVFIYHIKINSNVIFKNDYSESCYLRYFSRNNLPEDIKESDKIWIEKWKKENYEVEID